MEPESSPDRKIPRRTFLERGLMLAVGATLGGAAGAETAKAALSDTSISHAKKTLVVGLDAVGSDFAPTHTTQGWGHIEALNSIYDSLYSYPNGDITKSLEPRLASGPPVRGRGVKREFVVPLRKGIKFHDGTPFNANAVVMNYKAATDKTYPLYDSKNVYGGVTILYGVTNVEALDDYRVKFTLNRPIGDFEVQLASHLAGIMSPKSITAAGSIVEAGAHPVGTGPYRFVEGIAGDHVTLEANPDYFRGKPKIDGIVIRAIPDSSALAAALLAGDVDVSWSVSSKDVSRLRSSSRLNVAFTSGMVTGYVEFNATGANGARTFADVRVRQAALHAINKRDLIAVALNGYGSVGAGLNPRAMVGGWSPQFSDYYKFDPAKAKSLLSAAGGSRDVTLSVPSNSYWPLLGQVVQNAWNAVGLNTTLKVIDATAFGATMNKAQHDAFFWDLTQIVPIPWAGYNLLFNPAGSVSNRSGGWRDTTLLRNLYSSIAEPSPKKLGQKIAQMDKIILENAVAQANYYPTSISAYTKRLKGFLPPSGKAVDFSRATLV